MAFYLDSRGTDSKVVLHWDNAIDRFKRAMALDPNIPYPAAGLAEIYMSKARVRRPNQEAEKEALLREAVVLLKRASTLNQFNPRYLIRLGEANLLLGKETEARDAYEKAIEVDPASSFVRDLAGRFFRQIGDDDRARIEFNRSMQLYSDFPSFINLEEMGPSQPK
jgi:tetratricopeptide (TPR) repeat protein